MAREPSDTPGLEWKKSRSGMMVPRWRARRKAVALEAVIAGGVVARH